MNSIIIYVIIITLIICIVCTILGYFFWDTNRPIPTDIRAEYLFYTLIENQGINEGFKIFGSFFTIFNTLIPISVMITLEVVKGLQIVVMDMDEKLKEKVDEKSKILNMKLHEDLGNIKYIFTDKTGTLTKNEMEFKACTIFSKLYDDDIQTNDYKNNCEEDNNNNTPFPGIEIKKSIFSNSFNPNILKSSLRSDEPIKIMDGGKTPFLSIRETSIEFFLNIALNHNVLTEVDNETKETYYSGSSPDEVVLVQSAKEIGIEFVERSGDISKVKILDKEFNFKVLHRFEYNSDRKRSSIIVRDEFGNIKLYMKGADKVILDKVDAYSKEFIYQNTKEHLDHFCKGGLRTLVYSMKMIPEEDYKKWEDEYNKKQEIVLIDKTKKNELELKINDIENKMLLMGATALEDKLQDDVRGCLNDYIEADIKVWMLTGDQLDTAESIGYSCRLFNDDTEIFKLRDGYKLETVKEILKKFLEEMEKTEENILNYKIAKKRKYRNSSIHNGNYKRNKNNDIILNAQALMKLEMEKTKLNKNKNNFNREPTAEFNFKNNFNENNTEVMNLRLHKQSSSIKNNQDFFNSPVSPIPNIERIFSKENIGYSNKESFKIKSPTNINDEELYGKDNIFDNKPKRSELDSISQNNNGKKVPEKMQYSIRYDKYKADFTQLRQNLENGNISGNFNNQGNKNIRNLRTQNESSNNMSNNSYGKGMVFNNINPSLLRKDSQLPIDINQLNAEGIKFIGGNLDKKSNKITLNFVKNSQNSLYNTNRPMTPGHSKSYRPVSSSVYSYNRMNFSGNNNVVFKNNLNNINNNMNNKFESNANVLINNIRNNNHNQMENYQSFDDTQNYEPGDFSIIKYMVDVDLFENNKNNQNYTFIKNIVGDNIQASKMNEDGVIEFKPIEKNGGANNLNIKSEIEMLEAKNNYEYVDKNYRNIKPNLIRNIDNSNNINKDINEESVNLDLDKLLEDYKNKIMKIDSRRIINPFDFVIRKEKKDFALTNFGLIIEGSAIVQCLDPQVYPIFWDIIIRSRAVICCRCSPNFKSDVVEFVKKMSNQTTLAIGDGGNDVNMIKAANIGVGIFGKEGHQAAFNSDYAISQFKYLNRLLFFHGRYSILRNSYFINFFFFKNLIFTFPQFWFSLFSGFSGALLWDDWYYLGYNSFISTLPAGSRMLFEEDIDITFKDCKDKKIKNLLEG